MIIKTKQGTVLNVTDPATIEQFLKYGAVEVEKEKPVKKEKKPVKE